MFFCEMVVYFNGYYSFLCESRGAKKVVAVDWLEFPGFTAAHKILNSNVEFRKLVVDESNFGFTDLKSKIGTIDEIKEKTGGKLVVPDSVPEMQF